MTDIKTSDAPVAETKPEQPKADAGKTKSKSVTTSVWAPAGGVAKNAVMQAAIQSVRDAIPVVYDLTTEITGAKKGKHDGQDGTNFEVTITYTERGAADTDDVVDLDNVIKGLEVPSAVHDGDPDFLTRSAEPNPFA